MTSILRDKLFVGGGWTPGRSGRTFEVVNPSTEETLAAVPRGTPEDVDDAVRAAETALGPWWRFTPEDRGRLLYGVARSLEARLEEFARLETLDTGKPLGHAKNEISGCVRYFDYYAGVADKIHGETVPLGPEPSADGAAVRELFVRRGWDGVRTETVRGEGGTTDFVRVVVPGSGGKARGGDAPTLGILGRLGGLGARPGSVGYVSDGDGAVAALGAALKLVDMSLRGDVLEGDVIVCTHVCPDAPTRPHDPVPFMDSPVDMETMNAREVDPAMDAVLSIDTTKGNRLVNHRGIALSPPVKEGRPLRGGTQRRRAGHRHQRQGSVDGRNPGRREDLRHDPRRLRKQQHLRRCGCSGSTFGRRDAPARALPGPPPHRVWRLGGDLRDSREFPEASPPA